MSWWSRAAVTMMTGSGPVRDLAWTFSIRRIRSVSAVISSSVGDSATVALSTKVTMDTPTISGSRNDSAPTPPLAIMTLPVRWTCIAAMPV